MKTMPAYDVTDIEQELIDNIPEVVKTKNKKSYQCSFNEGVTQFRAFEGEGEQGLG